MEASEGSDFPRRVSSAMENSIQLLDLEEEAADLDLEPSTTLPSLRRAVEAALGIPEAEQRLVYAGTQLEECVTPAWRARRSGGGGALAAALGLERLLDGAFLTLEHHGIQKGSVLNVVRKVSQPEEASRNGYTQVEAAYSAAQQPQQPQQPLQPLPPQPGGQPELNATFPASALQRSPCSLHPQLDALNDLELLVLLRPLLRRRPTLRAALLAEEAAPAVPPSPAGAMAAAPAALPALPPPGEPWRRGDRCSVWSNSAQRWCDGEVVNLAERATEKVPQGSVEVAFELGRKRGPRAISN
ncbi:unnamed protein product [Symbiodinium sp. CCMP2456]|nr:unnamed protein product [Symbiodinium sp. CCMP2456]